MRYFFGHEGVAVVLDLVVRLLLGEDWDGMGKWLRRLWLFCFWRVSCWAQGEGR